MNITPNPAADATARSIEAMGNLLKNITAQTMGLEDKMLKVNVTEKVNAPGLGEKVDFCA
ncbi:MAG TPA: hypothetical protein PK986_07955 [Spirochaetota bacterium]|nr:hypothetical protein [Spirochaetota bacterium]HQO40387.1 hypothetical protein [Spirochaetota bacterium]